MKANALLRGIALGAASLMAATSAAACSFDSWSLMTGTPLVGQPDQVPPVARYSGLCAMRVDAIGSFVTDDRPDDETVYRVRFYVYTGTHGGGTADIFQARNGSGTNMIRVQYSGSQLSFGVNGTATTRTATVVGNRWYSVELAWEASASGSLGIVVQGAGSATAIPVTPITGINNASDRIAQARLGKIAGAGTGFLIFDAFESRRITSPGRLLRGDANGNGAVNVSDVIAIRNEALGGPLVTGQPDCNESGGVNVTDVVCARNIALGL